MEYTKESSTSDTMQKEMTTDNMQPTNPSLLQGFWHKKYPIVLVVLVILLGGLLLAKQVKFLKPQTRRVTVNKQMLQRRSADQGLINRALTGKAIDVNTGKIVKAARLFSVNDKTVYLELDLATAPKGTVIDYIRYKNGRYIDHGEVVLQRSDTKYLLFNWIINNLLNSTRNGKWRVATYTNGILAKQIDYEISNNQISYVYPDETVRPTDLNYHLSAALHNH